MIQVLLNIVSLLNILFIIIVVFFDKKKPESTLAWVLILFFVPYVGIFLYIVFGEFFRFGVKKKERDKILNDKLSLDLINKQIKYIENDKNLRNNFKWADLILMNSKEARSIVTFDNEIEVFHNASDKYDRLFDDIKSAKDSINISYYIIKKDFYGKQLLDLLVEKAKEGVEVRLIFDHIGSKITSKKFFKPLIDVGGKVEKFFPSRIFLKLYINHRNHRKMVIIDGEIGYIGGMNIGKEYVGADKKITPWCDRHLRIVGGAVLAIQTQFFLDYLFVSKEKIEWEDPNILSKFYKGKVYSGDKPMQIVASGPDYKESNIRNSYLKMINNAKDSIIIETPYLIPDEAILTSLKLAANSGVNVKIIIPGVPDKKAIYYATLSYAKELVKSGVEVYAYKGFMHSKLMIVDDNIVNIGSANMDRRSFSLNFEINSIVYDVEFNEKNRKIVEEELNNSVLMNSNEKNNFFVGILEKLARLFAPII
jgi:cardiolipin synthase